MKLKSRTLGIIIFIIFFGGISTTNALNLWQTTSSKIPIKFSTGDFAGQYNPVDIRGSYTFGDVSSIFEIPLEDLSAAFNLNNIEDPALTQLKILEAQYEDLKAAGFEIGTDSVRIFVALYKGLPYTSAEGSYLLKPAHSILMSQGNLSQEQVQYLENHLVEPNNTNYPLNSANTSPQQEPDSEEIVKGKTTFQEVLDWGLSKVDVEETLGQEMPNPLMVIRDFCTSEGLEFSLIKNQLQEKIAETN